MDAPSQLSFNLLSRKVKKRQVEAEGEVVEPNGDRGKVRCVLNSNGPDEIGAQGELVLYYQDRYGAEFSEGVVMLARMRPEDGLP